MLVVCLHCYLGLYLVHCCSYVDWLSRLSLLHQSRAWLRWSSP